MARKKKSTVIPFPGPWENLHVLIKNLHGEAGTEYGYVLITVPPGEDGKYELSHNYEGADKFNRKLICDILESLSDSIRANDE